MKKSEQIKTFKDQRNELLAAWIIRCTNMPLDQAVSYMEYFISAAKKHNNNENLAELIQTEMNQHDCTITLNMALDMIQHYGNQVRNVMISITKIERE